MKLKLASALLLTLPLTGCINIMLDIASSHDYQTKWNQQCLIATQDIGLYKGHKTDTLNKKFLASLNPNYIPGGKKRLDILQNGTTFKVSKIYDNYIHGLDGNWHLRVNLKILDGPHQGLEVEIPGTRTAHPEPYFLTHKTQNIAFTAREDLQPNTIEFNPDFLIKCDQ